MKNIHAFRWLELEKGIRQVENPLKSVPDQAPKMENDVFKHLDTPDPKPDPSAPERNKKLSKKLTPLLQEVFGAGKLDISRNDPASLIAGEWITAGGKVVSFNFTKGNTIGLYHPIDREGIWRIPLFHRFPVGQKGPTAIRAGFRQLLNKVDAIEKKYGTDIKNAKGGQDYLPLYNKITKALGKYSLYYDPQFSAEESLEKMETLRNFYEKSFLPAFQKIFNGECKVKMLSVGAMEILWNVPRSPNSNTISLSPQSMRIDFPDAGKAAAVNFRQSNPDDPESFPSEPDLALGLRYMATKTLCKPYLKASR